MVPRRPNFTRCTIRLKHFDYTSARWYFVTINTYKKKCILGEISEDKLILSPIGKLVKAHWFTLHKRFKNIRLDEFTVMPNHIHGIIAIIKGDVRPNIPPPTIKRESSPSRVRAGIPPPTNSPAGHGPPSKRYTLGQILAYFKYQTTKRINQLHGNPGIPLWHRNYYEHIIRHKNDLGAIRAYIRFNHLKWDPARL